MPTKSNAQSHMDVFLNKAAGVDDNGQIDNIAYKKNILTKTADYTVLASESGSIFIFSGTADINFTLPSVTDGAEFSFIHGGEDVAELKISASAAGALTGIASGDYLNAALTTTTADIGGRLDAVSDGTSWFVQAVAGTVTFATA